MGNHIACNQTHHLFYYSPNTHPLTNKRASRQHRICFRTPVIVISTQPHLPHPHHNHKSTRGLKTGIPSPRSAARSALVALEAKGEGHQRRVSTEFCTAARCGHHH